MDGSEFEASTVSDIITELFIKSPDQDRWITAEFTRLVLQRNLS